MRQALREAGFDEVTLCRCLNIPTLASLGEARWDEDEEKAESGKGEAKAEGEERKAGTNRFSEILRQCIGLFLFGRHLPRAELERTLGRPTLEAFLELGLLRGRRVDPASVFSPVFLYPALEFLIASDRHDDPDSVSGTCVDAQEDVVFPAIFGGTLRFLSLLPSAGSGDALDLCGGSGIGALCLARTARTAVSADITERATRYAEFNGRLNACQALEAVCGDLYEPVAGRQFDCITAHPPYVPALGSRMIYRDAGAGGEDITQAIVAGLPAHLRPGGQALILCQGRDAKDGAFEERARGWLGSTQAEFDVLFALQGVKTIDEEVAGLSRRTFRPPQEALAALRDRFVSMGTRQFVYGALFLHRHQDHATPPWTARTRLANGTTGPDFERLISWHHRCQEAGFNDWLAGIALRMSPHLQLTVRHAVQEGELVPAEFVLETDHPLKATTRFDGWVVPLVARCDGQRTAGDLYAAARQANELPVDFELRDFLDLMALLVARGYLVDPRSAPESH